MIERIIYFSIKNKIIVVLAVLALIGWGTYSLTRLPIDAIPDITNNQVQVISLAPSLAVQEMESFITAPIEVAVANIPGIIELRSISRLGLSVVTVVFKDDVDLFLLGGKCPVGINTTILDISSEPARILRNGPISCEDIKMLINI